MRYRKLDANGDYVFGHGLSDFYINVPAAPAQSVQTRLGLFTNEWFLDLLDGTPWLTDVIGKGTIGIYDRVIQARILGTQGVSSILQYSSDLDTIKRKLTINPVQVDTIYGPSEVMSITL